MNYSIEGLREELKKTSKEIVGHYVFKGESKSVSSKMVNGEMDTLQLNKPFGEMITKGDIPEELYQKVILDVELGRASVPTIYSPIYDTITDANFPQDLTAKWALWGAVVFLTHLEGQEVKFGTINAEKGPVAHIATYAAGFEYTQDMVKYNQSWNMTILNQAFGEAYNALLNHIHLYPILIGPALNYASPGYAAANKTATVWTKVDGTKGTSGDYDYVMTLRATIKQGIKDANTAKRPVSVLLSHPAAALDIAEAVNRLTLSSGQLYGVRPSSILPSLSDITSFIYYSGWTSVVGEETYEYEGVPTTKIYLIRPKKGFKELVKHDLQVESNDGDLSRLIAAQVIGVARRGVYAALAENIQECTVPAA
jgi:hypothetical protein